MDKDRVLTLIQTTANGGSISPLQDSLTLSFSQEQQRGGWGGHLHQRGEGWGGLLHPKLGLPWGGNYEGHTWRIHRVHVPAGLYGDLQPGVLLCRGRGVVLGPKSINHHAVLLLQTRVCAW